MLTVTAHFFLFCNVTRMRGAFELLWAVSYAALGLWAAASPSRCLLTRGIAHADSWATDAHKWLNVPYDSGIVIVRDPKMIMHATDYPGEYLRCERGAC